MGTRVGFVGNGTIVTAAPVGIVKLIEIEDRWLNEAHDAEGPTVVTHQKPEVAPSTHTTHIRQGAQLQGSQKSPRRRPENRKSKH